VSGSELLASYGAGAAIPQPLVVEASGSGTFTSDPLNPGAVPEPATVGTALLGLLALLSLRLRASA
jgi:hypothetical protein